ncbi:equilibrative nucleoside transporter 3 [Phlebotomus argentipes]|uniref:equilibrative nucleoside transporter 3 n=1 Tax=Phlebotomus argentipes TaxID=94469 RepID=UPI00289312E3|nr:equilibrative nucleoside transporter 3 [Phlebotomus argentipes]
MRSTRLSETPTVESLSPLRFVGFVCSVTSDFVTKCSPRDWKREWCIDKRQYLRFVRPRVCSCPIMDHSINSRPLLQPSDSEFAESDGDARASNGDVEIRSETKNEPSDRLNVIYMIFYLLGMTTLLPWNFFITAENYWMFKFRNVTGNDSDVLTPIQRTFTSDLSVSSAVPNTVFLVLNAFLSHRIPLRLRMLGSMGVIFVLFIFTTAFVEVDTDAWQRAFFGITITTVVVMNIAAAILSGGLFGIAGQFPSEYMTAVVSGQALGGIFAALCEVISLTFGASPKTTALVYFSVAIVVMIISLAAYFFMSRTLFFKFYTAAAHTPRLQDEARLLGEPPPAPNFRLILRKIWLYGFSEWFVFVVTLSVYPAVTVLVNSEHKGNGHLWNDVFFTTVVNYLIFNSGDYLGRIIAGLFEWPQNRPRLVAFFTVIRVAFIPIFLMCNSQPRENLPVIVHSDIVFILLMSVFALTNGYIANIALLCAPKIVASHEKEVASSMMAAFLGIGLAFGSGLGLIFVEIL